MAKAGTSRTGLLVAFMALPKARSVGGGFRELRHLHRFVREVSWS